MENRKDIGQAINDKLNSLDKMPREQVWSGISYELQKKKKRRIGFFFFWTKIVGILLIGAIAATYIYQEYKASDLVSPEGEKRVITVDGVRGGTSTVNTNGQNLGTKTNEENIRNNNLSGTNNILEETEANSAKGIKSNTKTGTKNTDNKSNPKNRSKNASLKLSKSGNPNGVSPKSGKNKSKLFSKIKSKKSHRKSKDAERNSKPAKEKKLLSENKTTDTGPSNVDLTSLQTKTLTKKVPEVKTKRNDSIAKKEKEKTININMYPKDSIKTDSVASFGKIQVDAFFSPTLFGYFNNNSTLDGRLDSLSKNSEINFSYGAGLTYELTEKISVRIGFSKTNISYTTKNVPVDETNYRGIAYNPNISNETIFTASNGSERMDVTQKISYTEIPVEVKYRFLDKKLGLKSSLGFSYLILGENKVSIKTLNGYSQDIGKTKNLSSTSISLNLGLEVDYPVFKNTKVFAEPIFNYQLKAFSDNNFKQYIFGIHTGIRYSFNN